MATPVSTTRPAAYSILPSPPAKPNPSTSGEFLLQLLQQNLDSNSNSAGNISRNGSGNYKNIINSGDVISSTSDVVPSRHNSLSSGSAGSCSRTSSSEADDELLRFADPAVAAMGPSHRLTDMPNAQGILPLQDLHNRHFMTGHHSHGRMPGGPPSMPFDGGFARQNMDHGLASPAMESSMFCPAPNQYFRPYPYGVMDQGHNPNSNTYGNIFASPHHQIGHPGSRHDVIAGHMLSEGRSFPTNGYYSHPVPPGVAENPNLFSMYRPVNAQDVLTSQMANKTPGVNGLSNVESHVDHHLITQFGSLEVEISSQVASKECNPLSQGNPKAAHFSLLAQHNKNTNIDDLSDVHLNSDGHYSQLRNGNLNSRGDPTFSFCASSDHNLMEAQGGNRHDAQSLRSVGMLKRQERETVLTPNRNGASQWVAVGKDKKIDDMRTMPKPEELSAKPPNDSRRRNIQSQDWRSRQPNESQWKNMDSGNMKLKDQSKKISRGRNNLGLQHGPTILPSGAKVESEPSSAIEQSKHAFHTPSPRDDFGSSLGGSEVGACDENDETILGCIGFLELDKDNGTEEGPKHNLRGSSAKDFSSDGKHRRPNLQKFHRRDAYNRADMEICTRQFVSIFESLIPSKDEENRRKQLLSNLEELVSGIWPNAKLYLFGSCANAFGVCNSDIDVCLSLDDENATRADVVRTLADVLTKNHMQNVQALPHARVPIVKYSDPSTVISCDVCVNNMLAVVNTKLLHDYAQIDLRLRQLAFVVKYWAKRRQVNETYRGTLSSYAYVLMCIHFLQQRKPPVLPCLQEMEPTYKVTVGEISCAYFDQVDRLKGFGQKNKETLADLVAMFFEYWAFRHDYSHSVISIRTGKFLSKVEKDWTRRIGNERHLICIEDPFETSHDLGRVVDKHSIRVLREEFQRAAKIMRQDVTPWVALFEPFVRQKSQDPE